MHLNVTEWSLVVRIIASHIQYVYTGNYNLFIIIFVNLQIIRIYTILMRLCVETSNGASRYKGC